MKNKYPNRRSIRLQSWNYAWPGYYFITICTKNFEHTFGEVQDRIMKLNSFGEIARQEWIKTSEIRNNVIIDEFVIMPNHMHGIIQIIDHGRNRDSVRAYRDTPVLPNCDKPELPNCDKLELPNCDTPVLPNCDKPELPNRKKPAHYMREHFNSNRNQINNQFEKRSFRSPSNDLGAIVRGYKAAVTTKINKSREVKGIPVWHRNYYEHIIRNQEALSHIRFYIKSNPRKWHEDRFNSIT